MKLVLINGISGNIGGSIARSLLAKGHQVRGLGRSPEAIDADIRSRLESFVKASNWYDTAAHDRACAGVHAVVNATAAHAHLMLDHSLLLFRAAERAGVKIFVANAWNYNWTKTPLGYHEPYDPLIMFKQQVELSSTLKPVYVFTGVLAEFWFNAPVKGWLQAENPGFSSKNASCAYFGDGKLRFQFTTFADAAEFTVEIMLRQDAEQGGCFEVMSFGADVWEMKDAFEKITGRSVTMTKAGSTEDMKKMAFDGRAQGQKHEYQKYMGMLYYYFTYEGKYLLDEKQLYAPPDVKTTSMEQFLAQHKDLFSKTPSA